MANQSVVEEKNWNDSHHIQVKTAHTYNFLFVLPQAFWQIRVKSNSKRKIYKFGKLEHVTVILSQKQ